MLHPKEIKNTKAKTNESTRTKIIYITPLKSWGFFSRCPKKKKHFCAVARPEGLRHIASWLVTDKGDSELE